jgi:hypothetical protein
MDQIELECPFCAGRFPVAAAAESRVTACPHCGRAVTVPATPRQPTPPPTPDLAASLATCDVPPRSPFDLTEPAKVIVNRQGEPVPLRRCSPEERARYRNRLNLAFAAIGMAVLTIALVALLRLRP